MTELTSLMIRKAEDKQTQVNGRSARHINVTNYKNTDESLKPRKINYIGPHKPVNTMPSYLWLEQGMVQMSSLFILIIQIMVSSL